MTKEQLIDKFARFILENTDKDKYFYPKDVQFRSRNVVSIHYNKLYDDYEIYTEEEELNSEKEEMDEDYFYYFKDLSFSEISMLFLACTRRK